MRQRLHWHNAEYWYETEDKKRHLMNQGHVGLLKFDHHVLHYLCGGCNDPKKNTDIRQWTEDKRKASDEPGPRRTAEVWSPCPPLSFWRLQWHNKHYWHETEAAMTQQTLLTWDRGCNDTTKGGLSSGWSFTRVVSYQRFAVSVSSLLHSDLSFSSHCTSPSPVTHVFLVCVCACVHACMGACVRAYVCGCLGAQVHVCACKCDEMSASLCLCKCSGLLWDVAPSAYPYVFVNVLGS